MDAVPSGSQGIPAVTGRTAPVVNDRPTPPQDAYGVLTVLKYEPSLDPPFVVLTSMPPMMRKERVMAELDEWSWSDAIGMYERRATIAKVTSREHENWLLDLLTLMRGDTRDARGWRTVDMWEGEPERLDEPSYPFVMPPEALATADAWKPYCMRSRVRRPCGSSWPFPRPGSMSQRNRISRNAGRP
ncbi:hypothetical protein LT493_41515 [Streptomyces tricolor]|nr:hypothetical protein [Streptomyces tricolor]